MKIKLKPFQDEFIFSKARFPALVAAIGTGKSLSGIMKMMIAMEGSPKNLGLIVRKEFTDLKDSTIKDFQHYTGLTVGTNKDVILPNGSVIMFRHGDEINVLKNINLGAILVEQAEEFETDETFTFLRDRLRRNDVKSRFLALIANTNGHNWIYNLWKINSQKDPEFYLTEATMFDNIDNLPADFVADREKEKISHPTHYNRYVLNSWEEVDAIDLIILPQWIKKCAEKEIYTRAPFRRLISIDVARFGDDKTVMYALENGKQIEKREYEKKNTMETVGWAIKFGEEIQTNSFAVDEIGVGAGVSDRLQELKKEVVFVNSAKGSINSDKYYNIRAEAYAHAAEMFQEGLVEIDDKDEDLREQLGWARYKSIKSSGVLQVESKEEIKKRYKRSPDNADAFVFGLWAMPKVSVVGRIENEFETELPKARSYFRR